MPLEPAPMASLMDPALRAIVTVGVLVFFAKIFASMFSSLRLPPVVGELLAVVVHGSISLYEAAKIVVAFFAIWILMVGFGAYFLPRIMERAMSLGVEGAVEAAAIAFAFRPSGDSGGARAITYNRGLRRGDGHSRVEGASSREGFHEAH